MLKKNLLLQKIFLVLFGFCLAIVIMEIGLRLGGSVILHIQEHRNQQAIKKQGAFRIICLGESTTQGQYPPYLEKILNQSNPKIKFSVIDKGVAGIRTTEIVSNLEAELDKYQPNLVITMMGINDSGNHLPFETTNPSKQEILLRSFKVYKLSRLLWLRLINKLDEVKGNLLKGSNQPSKELSCSAPQSSPANSAALNPADNFEYRQTGHLYRDQARSVELEQLCKKAIELKPDDDSCYIQLAWFYADWLRYIEAEQMFKKALEVNLRHDAAYLELGSFYRNQGRLAEAEQALKNAIAVNPNNSNTLSELGVLYSSEGRFSEAGQLFKKAIELAPDNELLYGRLALISSELGDQELFNKYSVKANHLKDGYYNSTTANNYHMLKKILDRRRIRLVCAQYPMQNIESLKKIFEKEARGNIIFVDNERIFKDAIRKEGYKEYFVDMFAGDFGHCTVKGNELLARNIANAILKKVFNKL